MTLEEVKRKARCGRRNWVLYRDASGEQRGEPEDASSLKRAMLAVGPKGRFLAVSARSGATYAINWRLAILRWRDARAY